MLGTLPLVILFSIITCDAFPLVQQEEHLCVRRVPRLTGTPLHSFMDSAEEEEPASQQSLGK
jgi:hypothetical protein